MRVIEQEIIQALQKEKDFQTSVTEDMYRKKEGRRDVIEWHDEYPGIFTYKLWGHQIAKGDTISRTLEVSDCGYPTATTTSRLNALFAGLDIPMAVSIRKKKTVYTIHGQEVKPGMLHYYAGEWTVSIS